MPGNALASLTPEVLGDEASASPWVPVCEVELGDRIAERGQPHGRRHNRLKTLLASRLPCRHVCFR